MADASPPKTLREVVLRDRETVVLRFDAFVMGPGAGHENAVFLESGTTVRSVNSGTGRRLEVLARGGNPRYDCDWVTVHSTGRAPTAKEIADLDAKRIREREELEKEFEEEREKAAKMLLEREERERRHREEDERRRRLAALERLKRSVGEGWPE